MKTFYFTQSVIQNFTVKAKTIEEAKEIFINDFNLKHDKEEYIPDSTYMYDEDYNDLDF